MLQIGVIYTDQILASHLTRSPLYVTRMIGNSPWARLTNEILKSSNLEQLWLDYVVFSIPILGSHLPKRQKPNSAPTEHELNLSTPADLQKLRSCTVIRQKSEARPHSQLVRQNSRLLT